MAGRRRAPPRRATPSAIVVEGYMDVIALHRAGFATAVAPLGTALTEAQIEELWRLAPEPVLCFDGDAAGQRAAGRALERALPLLKPGLQPALCHPARGRGSRHAGPAPRRGGDARGARPGAAPGRGDVDASRPRTADRHARAPRRARKAARRPRAPNRRPQRAGALSRVLPRAAVGRFRRGAAGRWARGGLAASDRRAAPLRRRVAAPIWPRGGADGRSRAVRAPSAGGRAGAASSITLFCWASSKRTIAAH